MKLMVKNRTEFVTNMSRLAFWYLATKTENCGNIELFRYVLNAETPIYRLTELWDREHHPAILSSDWHNLRWEKIVDRLYQLLKTNRDNFEDCGYRLLEPLLLGRIERDTNDWPWIPCGYCPQKLPDENIFGAFAFEARGALGKSPTKIEIHIGNNKIPNSPFADMNNLQKELLALVEYVLKEYPECKIIGCNSWLNSHDRFTGIFPPGWVSREAILMPSKVGYGYNWWGQFVSRTGGFNFCNAELMRKTGTFPFRALDGFCMLTTLYIHLKCNTAHLTLEY